MSKLSTIDLPDSVFAAPAAPTIPRCSCEEALYLRRVLAEILERANPGGAIEGLARAALDDDETPR